MGSIPYPILLPTRAVLTQSNAVLAETSAVLAEIKAVLAEIKAVLVRPHIFPPGGDKRGGSHFFSFIDFFYKKI